MKALRTWAPGTTSEAGLWVRQGVATSLGMVALALVTGSLGNLSRVLNGTLAVGVLLALVLVMRHRCGRIEGWQWVAAGATGAAGLIAVARGGPGGLLGAAIFFFALSLPAAEEFAGNLSALLLTALFSALYWIGVTYLPGVWYAEQAVATHFSGTVGMGLRLGPSALGLPLFWLYAFYALSTFLLADGLRRTAPAGELPERRHPKARAALVLMAWIAGLVLAEAAYIWLQPPLGSWLLTYWPASPATPAGVAPDLTLTYLESLPLLFVLLALVSAPGSWALPPHGLRLSPRPGTGRWAVAGLVLVALAGTALTLDPPPRAQRGTILFYDAGHLDWGRPSFGRYGPQSGGTFGLWPNYLAAYRYQAQIGSLTAENLAGAQAVVLITPPEALEPAERERLLRFVAEGGGLVIWGEHTGVGGIREPINDLLARLPGTPIELRFDSAVPARQGWVEGLVLHPIPALYDGQDAADLVIAVGASLDIKPPAQPLIVGRFGHSDKGDVGNSARNYVGDMRYQPGEPLGDLVLAAAVAHGQGRIAVLGDTTPAGSVNLMTAMPFHARLLDWVTSRPPHGPVRLLHNGWLAVLLLTTAGACLAVGRSRLALAGAAAVLGVVVATTGCLNRAASQPPVPVGPIAYVDISHLERFDRLLWEDTSLGGLDYNLVRNGFVPLLLHRIDADVLAEAQLLVVIAPGQPFTAHEIATIRRWVEGGGRLLLTVGAEEREASAALLHAFRLAVDTTPLGPAEVEQDTGLVRFHEAWPVQSEAPGARTVVEAYGYPVVAYQPWGKGAVVLIGDSAFLLGPNLEGQDQVQEGNILLLRAILQTYLPAGKAP